ncbi:hypothetical protein U8335_25245 [Roseiconus lacunae]|uniref:helix-turn-helix transcriptional regulator n=1 Tax=Roseiconus lacunae TaxID=2605694 RepID=UPI0030938F93|nr:hypothetical protein U8335_25245 [Stieleria sp. HD01]
MPDILLRDIDPDCLRREIVADVLAAVREVMLEQSAPRTVDRQQMAELLGVSLPSLDREVAEGRIPSIKIGTRRVFEPRKVFDALANNKQNLSDTES